MHRLIPECSSRKSSVKQKSNVWAQMVDFVCRYYSVSPETFYVRILA
jgi:hypothetical protein